MPDAWRFWILMATALCITASASDDTQGSTGMPAGSSAFGDWRRDKPGLEHKILPADLPSPYQTNSSGNGPAEVRAPEDAVPKVLDGFSVQLFAKGFDQPRLMRTAPNGDVFLAETGANQIRVLRFADGASKPQIICLFATGLNLPFGIAFYPSGDHPEWVYVANTDSIVRFPYRNGDLQARARPEIIVPHLPAEGGHSTRDIVFSPDGTRMFISVGSASNAAEDMSRQSAAFIQHWQGEHGLGAAWDDEESRADVLAGKPDGADLHSFANGIRNCVGLALQPNTGRLWCSTNERDGLGDNLPPDYVTSVKEGSFYGWPWYYIGAHEDPRHAGERPDLKDSVTVPDVLIQPHSAPLQMSFYEGAQFPQSYRDDAFVALHGSWNRAQRTGYKIVRIRFKDGQATGAYEDFMTGLVVSNRAVWARPVGITATHDGALLVSEDANGTIWRVDWKGPVPQ